MFYIIGLGLSDLKDVSIKGLEIIKECDRVYLESYTSVLNITKEVMELFYGRPLIVATRELVENCADEILPVDEDEDVAFLVVGDPFAATTHMDLVLRAKEKDIEVKVIHNSSILTAVGCCGLQLYKYGETISIPFWTDSWQPTSFFEKIIANRRRELHTLCLLDIKMHEVTPESITKKKKEYLPPCFMTVKDAATQLIDIINQNINNGTKHVGLTQHSLVVGLAKVGSDEQRIVYCTLNDLRSIDLGPPLHCLIIPSEELHPLEKQFLSQFALEDHEFNKSL